MIGKENLEILFLAVNIMEGQITLWYSQFLNKAQALIMQVHATFVECNLCVSFFHMNKNGLWYSSESAHTRPKEKEEEI